jgi:hypothetical protein
MSSGDVDSSSIDSSNEPGMNWILSDPFREIAAN